jgi:hypothetical protein
MVPSVFTETLFTARIMLTRRENTILENRCFPERISLGHSFLSFEIC